MAQENDQQQNLSNYTLSRIADTGNTRLYLVILLCGALLFFSGLSNHGLWGAEEPYVGGIIREMADSGNWVVPTLNGTPYLEKPPLYYLLGALVARTSHSFSPWVLRFPSALFALATLVWVAWLATRRAAPAAGGWAALCLATSDLFLRIGHKAVVDMGLSFAVTVGLGCAWLVYAQPEHRDRWLNGVWLGAGLAFLMKGVIGPVLVLLPLLCHLAIRRDRSLLRRFLRPGWGMGCCLTLTGGWLILLFRAGGWPFLEEVLVRNTLGRFLQSARWTPATGFQGEHRENPLFYLTHSPFNLMPWMFLAGASLFASRRHWRRSAGDPAGLFLPLALGVDLLFLSASGMRRAMYVLPLVPILFLQMGLWLEARVRGAERSTAPREDRDLLTLLAVTGTFIVLATLIGPWLLVRAYRIPWAGPLAFTGLVAGLGLVITASLRARDFRRAMDSMLALWGAGTLWLVIVLPVFKDSDTRQAELAFQVAQKQAELTGTVVQAFHLSECDRGMASLILRKRVPEALCLAEVHDLLSRDRPVVLLASLNGQEAHAVQADGGQVLRPERPAGGLPGSGPSIVLNRAAWHSIQSKEPKWARGSW